MQACIDAYVCRIQLVVPILSQDTLTKEVHLAKTSRASQQFILAFCAYVANFGNALTVTHHEQQSLFTADLRRQSLDEALRAQDPRRVTDLNARSMFISFFLYGAFAGLGDYQQGWFYLREATTLFTMLKRDAISWYDSKANSCMFWILLISERYADLYGWETTAYCNQISWCTQS